MGTPPHARHAGPHLEEDPPLPLSTWSAVCHTGVGGALARLEGRKSVSPELSLHLCPACAAPEATLGMTRRARPPRPLPCPLPAHRLRCQRRLTFPAAELSAEGKNVF